MKVDTVIEFFLSYLLDFFIVTGNCYTYLGKVGMGYVFIIYICLVTHILISMLKCEEIRIMLFWHISRKKKHK